MNEFYTLAYQVHDDKIRDENLKRYDVDYQAKIEYLKFKVWCRAFKDADFSENNFKAYQKEENVLINFWIKKRIAELFYNYKIIYNNKLKKLVFKKDE